MNIIQVYDLRSNDQDRPQVKKNEAVPHDLIEDIHIETIYSDTRETIKGNRQRIDDTISKHINTK